MQVEIRFRWLWLTASLVVLVLLREHIMWLGLYVLAVLVGLVLWFIVLPRQALAAERTFHREALRLLASDDIAGLQGLAEEQWLIRRFGRPHVLPDTLGLAASAHGDHEKARALYTESLRAAPPEDRPRIELNLAAEELACGELDTAEGRYRAALARRPDLSPALANLGRLLVQRGESLDEAADLLARAAKSCDRRELSELHLTRAEALVRAGRESWREALEDAREAGAEPLALERIAALGTP